MKAPLLFEFDGRKAVVFGAGPTGLRRALKYASYGAKVRVVAPEIGPDAAARLEAAGIEILREGYAPDHLDGNDLCTAATDSPELNRRMSQNAGVGACCGQRQRQSHADFTFPAEFRRRPEHRGLDELERAPALDRQIESSLNDSSARNRGSTRGSNCSGKSGSWRWVSACRTRAGGSELRQSWICRSWTELSELEGLKRNGRPDLPEQLEDR